jgi:ribonuclease G
LRDSLAQTVTEPCACCAGGGRVLTPLILTYDIMRHLAAEAQEFPGCRLTVAAHPQVVETVQAEGQRLLTRLATEHQVQVAFTPQPHFPRDHFDISREWPGQ